MKALVTIMLLVSSSIYSFSQNRNTRPFDTSSNPTTLKIENNTGSIIHVCIAYYSNAEQCWISKGWLHVFIYNDITIPLSNDGILYVFGKAVDGKKVRTWGNDRLFCVDDDMKHKFKILQANEVNCKTKKRFDIVQISQGQNVYRFNP